MVEKGDLILDLDYNPCSFTIRLNSNQNSTCSDVPTSELFNWFNAEILHRIPGEVEVKFTVTEKMTNPAGVLHGGYQCAILDEVMGMTGATLGQDHFLYAIDIKVDYLRPAQLGQNLWVKGRIIRQGRNIINCIGEIYTDDCSLIAQAKSNLMV